MTEDHHESRLEQPELGHDLEKDKPSKVLDRGLVLAIMTDADTASADTALLSFAVSKEPQPLLHFDGILRIGSFASISSCAPAAAYMLG